MRSRSEGGAGGPEAAADEERMVLEDQPLVSEAVATLVAEQDHVSVV